MVRTQGRKNDNYGTSIFCTEYNGWWSTSVYYISADVRDVSVKSISGNLANSSYSSVNGTFFNNANESLGIAVGPSGVAVKNGGERTAKGFKRETLFCYNAGLLEA